MGYFSKLRGFRAQNSFAFESIHILNLVNITNQLFKGMHAKVVGPNSFLSSWPFGLVVPLASQAYKFGNNACKELASAICTTKIEYLQKSRCSAALRTGIINPRSPRVDEPLPWHVLSARRARGRMGNLFLARGAWWYFSNSLLVPVGLDTYI